MKSTADFDQYAEAYEAELNQALSISGEGKDFFARGRVEFLAGCLRRLHETPRSAMDYGCGIGGTALLLQELVGVERVVGLDLSERSIHRARLECGSDVIRFLTFDEFAPAGDLDVAYCNGVFHHIPSEDRMAALHYIRESLRPGGIFALWENNPWNPGTRYVMSKCAFDRNARTLTSGQATRLLNSAGFEVMRSDFLFCFPKILNFLRFLEPSLSWAPLGAQYQILCRKPGR